MVRDVDETTQPMVVFSDVPDLELNVYFCKQQPQVFHLQHELATYQRILNSNRYPAHSHKTEAKKGKKLVINT